jgi:threonine dehydrogenase-like Zn-dependent dehydrogenase
MGHENVGVVARVGSEAAQRWGVQEGDLVIPEEYVPCMHCKYCYTGRFRFCNQTDRGYGQILRHGATAVDVWPSLWGGFSQYMYLPPNSVMHRIDKAVSPHTLALYLPLANGIQWACLYGEAGRGKTVVIQGPGQMGLSCAFAAKQSGADCVIVTGLTRDAARLDLALRLGADYVVDVEREGFREGIERITGGEGADVVVNVTGGAPSAVEDAMAVASKECTIVLAAAGDEPFSLAGLGERRRRDITLKTAHGHSYEAVSQSISYLTSGRYPELLELSTHQFPLARTLDALDTAAGVHGPAVHVTLLPSS